MSSLLTPVILWDSIVALFCKRDVTKVENASNNVEHISLHFSRDTHHLHSMLAEEKGEEEEEEEEEDEEAHTEVHTESKPRVLDTYQCVFKLLPVIHSIHSIGTSLIQVPVVVNISYPQSLWKVREGREGRGGEGGSTAELQEHS